MKRPRKNKQWAKEAMDALNMAWDIVRAENEQPEHRTLEYFYTYGPMFCAINRDEAMI